MINILYDTEKNVFLRIKNVCPKNKEATIIKQYTKVDAEIINSEYKVYIPIAELTFEEKQVLEQRCYQYLLNNNDNYVDGTNQTNWLKPEYKYRVLIPFDIGIKLLTDPANIQNYNNLMENPSRLIRREEARVFEIYTNNDRPDFVELMNVNNIKIEIRE